MPETLSRMQQLRGTTAEWAADDIVLLSGEIGVEFAGSTDFRIKIGDGVSTYSALPYFSGSSAEINTAVQDALDAKLGLGGGTMTGLLVLSGDPTTALGAATKQYVDSINTTLSSSIAGKLDITGGTLTGSLTLAADPVSALHASTRQYTDAADALKLSKSGDTMTGALVLAADPTDPLEAATKQYVDSGAYQTTVGGSSAYAGKVPRLNSVGLLDSSILPISSTYIGTVNLTVSYGLTGTYVAGNYYSVSTSGTIDGSWASKLNGAPTTCGAGQFIIYAPNGKWDLVGETAASASISGKLDITGGTLTGPLILAADPTSSLGAATKQYADGKLALSGGTMTGALVLAADPTASAQAATKQYVDAGDTARLLLSGGTMTGALETVASATTGAGFRLPHGTAPTTPVNGDFWTTSSGVFSRINGVTQQMAPLASPTFTGVPDAPTAAIGTNTTQVATTAFVLGQANSTSDTISMSGTRAAGTSNLYARADHVHPTDTSRAPLASPALTGTPTAPTATAGTNTTQIATTAFVQSALGSMTLLGTLTTTSGASQTLSGLTLTEYKFVRLYWRGVSSAGTAGEFSINGVTTRVPNSGATYVYSGIIDIQLSSGIAIGTLGISSGSNVSYTAYCATGYSTASTSITVGVTTNVFDAGSVSIYGVK